MSFAAASLVRLSELVADGIVLTTDSDFLTHRRHGRVDLAPAYDLLNSTIALRNPHEEPALPIRGR